MYTVQIYSEHCTVYSEHCTVYNEHCTVYSVHCTVNSVNCTVYSVYCTVYIVKLYVHFNLLEGIEKSWVCFANAFRFIMFKVFLSFWLVLWGWEKVLSWTVIFYQLKGNVLQLSEEKLYGKRIVKKILSYDS